MFKLLSFDVYGTLMDTPPTNAKAFRVILEEAGASNVNPMQFYQCWEERNIVHYREPYCSYKAIGRLSLEESLQHFGISGGSGDLVDRYFAMFPEMQPYPDVLRTLDKLGAKHRIALVSNIDNDLLQVTPVPGGIDLVCTAERARGYKPDGTLFRYLIANAGVAIPEILHSGQSQHTDMVGGKPLGLTVAWINRRNLELHPSVPKPDYVFPIYNRSYRCWAVPINDMGMDETELEKLARLSGKATPKALGALERRGYDLRGKLSVPISRVPRRAPPEKPKSDE